LNPVILARELTNNVIRNFAMIFSDVTVLMSDIAAQDWEKAGNTYADILVLSVGKLPPALTDSGITINKTLDNLHELIPHRTDYCFNPDGSKIPGRCGAPAIA